jgi:multidrug efflux pump
MTGIVDWAASPRADGHRLRDPVADRRAAAYVGLPKEGEPDIDIPGLFVSVPFPGISAEDSERCCAADGDPSSRTSTG